MRNKDTIEKCLAEIKHSGLPVVVFGTGSGGRRMEVFLKQHSIDVAAFCESRDYYTPGKQFCGKPVYAYGDLPDSLAGCNLVFAAYVVNAWMVLALGDKNRGKVYQFPDAVLPCQGIKATIGAAIKDTIWRLLPINRKKIVFSSSDSKRYGGSPRSITEELIRRNVDCKIVWFMLPGYERGIEFPEKVTVVAKSLSSLWRRYHLATAKVLVADTNSFVAGELRKKKGQYYIATQHIGIVLEKWSTHWNVPIKALDLAAVEKAVPPFEAFPRFVAWKDLYDLHLSNSKYVTEFYRRIHPFELTIFECGLPKNDVYFSDPSEAVRKVRAKLNIPENIRLALYAPTLSYESGENLRRVFNLNYRRTLEALERRFGCEWRMLVRLHRGNMEQADDFIQYDDKVINATKYDYMQDLLVAADVLITDYSSIMFDFPLSGKPVFLFSLDYSEFMRTRGMYFDYFSLPFPVAQSDDELCRNIQEFSEEKYREKWSDFSNKVGLVENGHASEAVADLIVRKLGGD